MNLTIINSLSYALPMTDGTTAAQLDPGTSTYTGESEVLIIGDKPSVLEQFKEAAATLVEFIAFWREKQSEAEEMLRVTVTNNGTKSVRYILGDGLAGGDIAPGISADLMSEDYIELRELGDVEQGHASTLEAS